MKQQVRVRREMERNEDLVCAFFFHLLPLELRTSICGVLVAGNWRFIRSPFFCVGSESGREDGGEAQKLASESDL